MKDFVDYKTAKELKELGFDEECCYYFTPDTKVEITHFPIEERNSTYKHNEISQPTYYQVFQWFREVHNIHSTIVLTTSGYDFHIKREPTRIVNILNSYSDYRECEIACIEYMINLVKNETSTT